MINSSPIRYLSNSFSTDLVPCLEKVEQIQPFPTHLPPGAGLSNFILNALTVPYYVLTYFTESGNNSEAALSLARTFMLIESLKDDLKLPIAWKYLEGPKVDYGLYF